METEQKKSEVVQVESSKLRDWTQFVKVLVNEHTVSNKSLIQHPSERKVNMSMCKLNQNVYEKNNKWT
jgi:hypothetical protein